MRALYGWTAVVVTVAGGMFLADCLASHEPARPREAELRLARDGIECFASDVGRLPQSWDELVASEDSNWQGPYVDTGQFRDVRENPVHYTIIDAKTMYFHLSKRPACSDGLIAMCPGPVLLEGFADPYQFGPPDSQFL